MSNLRSSLMLAAAVIALPGTAFAAGANANAPGTNREALVILTGADNLGGVIAGVLYGNTTNERAGGNGVTPSLSPGPWVCANPLDCFDGAAAGPSVGELIGGGNADFANGTDAVKTNFGQAYNHGGVTP